MTRKKVGVALLGRPVIVFITAKTLGRPSSVRVDVVHTAWPAEIIPCLAEPIAAGQAVPRLLREPFFRGARLQKCRGRSLNSQFKVRMTLFRLLSIRKPVFLPGTQPVRRLGKLVPVVNPVENGLQGERRLPRVRA